MRLVLLGHFFFFLHDDTTRRDTSKNIFFKNEVLRAFLFLKLF